MRSPGRAAALVLGALPALAFPAPSWWWLAWFGVVPLLFVVRAAPTACDGGVRAWCGLAGYVLATQYWLLPSSGPLLVAMAAGIGALWLPWGWAVHRLLSAPEGPGTTRQLLAALVVLPSAWVAAEAVRSWPSLGGPWASLGASQWNQPATLASAALGGVWLTSFLIVAMNTGIACVIVSRRRVIPLVAALVCAGLGPAWFVLGPAPSAGATARVALVQAGVIDDSAARQAAIEALTGALAGQRPDLVVWGESSVGVDPASHPDALKALTELSRRVGAYLLVNVDAPAATGGIYKSSVLIGPNGLRGVYRKTRLVPFGEYVPLRPLLGWITRHTKAATEDRHRGTGPVVLHAGSLPIGPLISFEALFGDLPRREVQLGAQLLVYQTSTSTFQGSWAQPQLASEVAVRAAEVGHPAVHAGLSGDSAAFDARGRKLAWCPSNYRGAIVVTVPLGSPATAYQRLGDWVLPLAFTILAAAGVLAAPRFRREQPPQAGGAPPPTRPGPASCV